MVAAQRNRTALGRGLGSLIPAAERQTSQEQGLKTIPVADILPGDAQPRKYFDDTAIAELAASIEEHGVLQPLVVRKRQNGQFELVAGERRWRACKKAGKKEVPVVVVDIADEKALTAALVENIQREDLNAIEEAESYRRLSQELGYTQDQIAKAIGKDRSTITNALRLLKLPKETQGFVMSKEISMGHARALLSLGEEGAIKTASNQVVEEGLSVRATESLVQELLNPTTKENNFKELRSLTADEKEVRRQLESHFGTKVLFKNNDSNKGSFTVHFSSKDHLNELLRRLDINI